MLRSSLYFAIMAAALCLTSCEDAATTSSRTVDETENPDGPGINRDNVQLPGHMIEEGSVFGLLAGGSIVSAGDKLEKGTMYTGADSVKSEVYYIIDSFQRVGYVVPRPDDITGIQEIHITSDRFMDKKGIGVGSSMDDFKASYADEQPKMSKMDGNDVATVGSRQYRFGAVTPILKPAKKKPYQRQAGESDLDIANKEKAAMEKLKAEQAKMKPVNQVTEVIITQLPEAGMSREEKVGTKTEAEKKKGNSAATAPGN